MDEQRSDSPTPPPQPPGPPSPPEDDDVFVASADDFDDDDFVEAPKWPKVVGGVSIGLGTFSMCCGGFMLVTFAFFQPSVAKMVEDMYPDGMPPAATSVNPNQIAAMTFGLAITILLIVAGVLSVMRRYPARLLHLVYGILGMISLVWSIKVQLDMQAEVAQWVLDNPDTEYARQQQMTGRYGEIATILFTIALGGIWPLFCLVWFGLVKRKPEDFTGGVDEPVV